MPLIQKFFFAFSLLLFSKSIQAQDRMKSDFQHPPSSAKPRVWWHWMNGNITKEGIQKDLEWMEKSGIGGFQNFDASLMTPVVVKEKLSFMSPAWKDAFRFTASLAKQKNLEMAIAGSPGWSVTGGPWVSPADAMKKYVWSETIISGGQPFTGTLKAPSKVTGPMQNTGIEAGGGLNGPMAGPPLKDPEYYQDVAVFAYPLSSKAMRLFSLKPTVSSSGGNFSWEQLTDGDLTNFGTLAPKKIGEDTYIQYEFPEIIDFEGLTVANEGYGELAVFRGGPENRSVTYSLDGINFSLAANIPGTITAQTTLSFPPIKAKFIRLVYKTLAPSPGFEAMFGGRVSTEPKGTPISEFQVHLSPKLNLFEAKAGFQPWRETPGYPSYNPVGPKPSEIVNLTSLLQSDGRLNWNAPAGNWAVYRFGYSLTGKKNHPASPEATGLEVDKIDKSAVTRYLTYYLDQYKEATSGLMGTEGLTHMVLDSYEAGHMTWTPAMMSTFKEKRGYDMSPWLPVLVGQIVQDAQASEKFLWDFRKTIGEMIVENHYEAIGDLLAKRGMKRYTESHESGRIFLADGMDVKRKADVPMSAMWQPGALAAGADEEIRSRADIRESASVAHLYGQNIVAGESMTTVGNSFSPHPGSLKRTADMEMASGLNRFVIHTSVHQPQDNLMPGFSLGPFGQWFTRQETWANQARVWGDYLGRSSYMLQQGRFIADILYFYGENTNITSQFTQALPAIPAGYEFDFVNASALRDVIQVKNKQITNPHGGTYAVIVLDESAKQMTLPTLQRLLALAKLGAPVAGQEPLYSPSLLDPVDVFRTTVAALKKLPNVQFGGDLARLLTQLKRDPDVRMSNQQAEILYVHRKTPTSDIYWLNSRSASNNAAQISFRVQGKKPSIWNPENGKVQPVGYRIEGNRTVLDLKFTPWDAYFIVFEGTTTHKTWVLPDAQIVKTHIMEGPWTVKFQAERGAPSQISLNSLRSLSTHEQDGVKYFSGVATYVNKFELSGISRGEKIMLDLGEVKNLAEVLINGVKVATLWKKPFQVDISQALKIGKNSIEINVINSWVNRLVGDAQPGAKKITFTSFPLIRPNTPMEESGLLGPVKIETWQE